jgi:preprotein translocase subunit SecY
MPFCPNPECPHVKKTGRAAAFVDGLMICTDCGSELMEKEMPIAREKRRALSDFQKRLIYTLGMIAIFRMLTHIPAPGINGEALDRFLIERGGEFHPLDLFGSARITVFALGLMPYISASVAVEILALFLKPLKSWRESGYLGRLKLRQTALITATVLAFALGYWIAKVVVSMNDGSFVYDSGIGYRLFLALTLTTGTFIIIGLANQITKKGLGHGISVIIFTSYAGGLSSHLFKLFNMGHEQLLSRSPFEYLLLAFVISAVLIAIIVIMEKSNKRIGLKYEDGLESYVPLKLTTAGIVPTDWAGYILMLPITVLSFMTIEPIQKIGNFLSPGKFSYSIIYAIVIFFLYFLFTSFFYRPKDMISSLQHKGATLAVPSGKNAEDYIDRVLEIMAFAGGIYLCLLFLLPEILIRLGFPIFVGGIGLIKTAAIVLDLLEESRIRNKSTGLTKIMEYHEVQKAGLFKGILDQRGIPCFLQGYYHRSLLYFFGPYIEISIFIPQDRSAEASELFERYIA